MFTSFTFNHSSSSHLLCPGICTVYPLDTAKMRLQVCPGKYTGTYNVLTTMVREQGVTSIYRGLFAPSIGFGFTFAVSFSAYGHGCRVISSYKVQDIKDLSFWDTMLAGAYTGVVQTPVRQVVDRVKGVMQIREREGGKSPYSWTGACAGKSNSLCCCIDAPSSPCLDAPSPSWLCSRSDS